MNNAPDVPRERWFAMTRLDENRAAAQLASKAGVQVSKFPMSQFGEIIQPLNIQIIIMLR